MCGERFKRKIKLNEVKVFVINDKNSTKHYNALFF